jgi:hypothetical protein
MTTKYGENSMKLPLYPGLLGLLLMASLPAEAHRFQPISIVSPKAVITDQDRMNTFSQNQTTSRDGLVFVSNSTDLTTEQISEILAAAAEDSVPSNPSRSAFSAVSTSAWLMIFCFFAAIVRLVLWCMALSRGAVRVSRGANAAFSMTSNFQTSGDDEYGAISEKMEERIAQAAAAYASGNRVEGNTVANGNFQPASEPGSFGRRA